MADECTWLGGTDVNFDTAANWEPDAVPVTGKTLLFNDRALQQLTGNIAVGDLAGLAFSVIGTSGFKYFIGEQGAGKGFAPADGFTTVIWNGMGIIPSYFEVVTAKTISRCVVNSGSNRDDLLTLLGAGSIDQLTVMNGRALLNSVTITSGGRVQVLGGLGSSDSRLTIDSGCTLTGTQVTVSGGKLVTSKTLVDFLSTGGETVLDGSAGVSGVYEQHGGNVWWDAISTIAQADIMGGTLAIRKDRAGRTLTASTLYPGGVIDFRVGGLAMTFTNALRNLGGSYLYPLGVEVTVGI